VTWNPNLPITYDRPFELWLYTTSLSRVAMRSFRDKNGESSRSVEVMFQNVTAMQVYDTWKNLTLREAIDSEIAEITTGLDAPPGHDQRFVALGETLRQGWIVCGAFGVAENDLDYTYMPELVAAVGLGVIGSTKTKGGN